MSSALRNGVVGLDVTMRLTLGVLALASGWLTASTVANRKRAMATSAS